MSSYLLRRGSGGEGSSSAPLLAPPLGRQGLAMRNVCPFLRPLCAEVVKQGLNCARSCASCVQKGREKGRGWIRQGSGYTYHKRSWWDHDGAERRQILPRLLIRTRCTLGFEKTILWLAPKGLLRGQTITHFQPD